MRLSICKSDSVVVVEVVVVVKSGMKLVWEEVDGGSEVNCQQVHAKTFSKFSQRGAA